MTNHHCTLKCVNTLRPRQHGRHFADDTFKRIFVNENVRISIKISLKFVPTVPINNIPALVQIMAWRRPGDKPLSELMMVRLPTHICVTRPQWVNTNWNKYFKRIDIRPSLRLYSIENDWCNVYDIFRRCRLFKVSTHLRLKMPFNDYHLLSNSVLTLIQFINTQVVNKKCR